MKISSAIWKWIGEDVFMYIDKCFQSGFSVLQVLWNLLLGRDS